MDIILVIVGLILLLAGIAGCLVPVIPGPPLAWFCLLLISFTSFDSITVPFLVITGVAAAAAAVLDNIIPVLGTKKAGGSKAGVIGASLGLLAGMFFAPAGIIICPFLGALAGEIINDSSDSRRSLKAALGTLKGFLLGIGMKLAVSLWFGWVFLGQVLRYFAE